MSWAVPVLHMYRTGASGTVSSQYWHLCCQSETAGRGSGLPANQRWRRTQGGFMFLAAGSWKAQDDFPIRIAFSSKPIYKWGLLFWLFDFEPCFESHNTDIQCFIYECCQLQIAKGINTAWFLACALNRQISHTIFFQNNGEVLFPYSCKWKMIKYDETRW